MYFFITIGQHPNRNVNSDVFVDRSPNPEVVYEDARKAADFVRLRYGEVKVVNKNRMVRNNGFYEFVSEYVLQMDAGGNGMIDMLVRMGKVTKRAMEIVDELERLGMDSRVWFSGVSRRRL